MSSTAKTDSRHYGHLIRQARKRNNLSQTALAENLGWQQSAISRLERDQISPSLDTLAAVFAAMGEVLVLEVIPLGQSLPECGNLTMADILDFTRMTPNERLEQARILSEAATALAAQGVC